MKDKIKLLSNRVANQIAAGEVVTHPACAVKEMMENAIDAGANEVIVNYRDSGYDLIQIIDNGIGMTPNDARMAFDRHATSKISAAKDIYALNTFGFRGEALASIAAVSKVELRTRPHDAEVGTQSAIEYGEFKVQESIECNVGSQFCVREIFQDMPARRRFLDKDGKNPNGIRTEFKRVALPNYNIAFELYGDDAPIYKLAPTTLAGRIVDVMGRGIKKDLLEIHVDTVIVKIRGFIGVPDSSKKRNSHNQFFFVNGRYFNSPALFSAIMRGYEQIIKPNTSPSFFLFFDVPTDCVDVNIHPQKTEVRFSDDKAIWNILLAGIRETLARTGAVPLMEFDEQSNMEIPVAQKGVVYPEPKAISNEHYNPFDIENERHATEPRDEMGVSNYRVSDGEESDKSDVVVATSGETDTYEIEEIESIATYRPTPQPITVKPRIASGGAMTLHENHDISWEAGFDEIESTVSYTPTTAHNDNSDSYVEIESHNEWENIEFEESHIDATQENLNLEEAPSEQNDTLGFNNISVTNGTFAWCKIGANMTVVDLKRAKERLLYDHYKESLKRGENVSQQLMFPITMELSDMNYTLMEQNKSEFTAVGFNIAYIGHNEIEIKALPADISTEVTEKLIDELLQLLMTPEGIAERGREKVASTLAYNNAQSMGRNITTQQAREIIAQLLKSGNIARTASGKLIMWQIGKEEIKKRLK